MAREWCCESRAQPSKGRWSVALYRIFATPFATGEYPIHAPKRGMIARAYREVDARQLVDEEL